MFIKGNQNLKLLNDFFFTTDNLNTIVISFKKNKGYIAGRN